MPSTFSRRCLGCLLLLCTSLSDGNITDLAMTAQDSSQSEVNFVTKMPAGHESSGVDVATQELKPASKQSKHSVSEHVIVLSGASLEENITVASPSKVELICKLDEKSDLKNPEVTWKRGTETISHTTKTKDSWAIQLTISESSQLGSYTCILKDVKEISGTFHLQVPKIEGREKPLITYEGDRAVMVCKTAYNPLAWTWYMTNGTELVPLNKILHKDKFQIKRPSAHVNRLEILELTREDTGVYWCEAAFDLGSNKARFQLEVLSIMAPLKPFIAVVAEVSILLTTIVLCEMYSKKKEKRHEKEFDAVEQLKYKPTEVEVITDLQKIYEAMHFKHSLSFEVKFIFEKYLRSKMLLK